MSTRFDDTDLTDAAWAWVAPVLPTARPGGRPLSDAKLFANRSALFANDAESAMIACSLL